MKRNKLGIIVGSMVAVVGVVFISFFIIVIGGISGRLFNPNINHEQMEQYFAEDYELLLVVRDYLVSSEYESIRLRPENYLGDNSSLMIVDSDSGSQRILISDQSVVDVIDTLRDRGYSTISKSNNRIRFVRWTTRNRGRGIMYLIDGNMSDNSELQFFTILEPLSKENWFFYELE